MLIICLALASVACDEDPRPEAMEDETETGIENGATSRTEVEELRNQIGELSTMLSNLERRVEAIEEQSFGAEIGGKSDDESLELLEGVALDPDLASGLRGLISEGERLVASTTTTYGDVTSWEDRAKNLLEKLDHRVGYSDCGFWLQHHDLQTLRPENIGELRGLYMSILEENLDYVRRIRAGGRCFGGRVAAPPAS